jgi:hypothetical protein
MARQSWRSWSAFRVWPILMKQILTFPRWQAPFKSHCAADRANLMPAYWRELGCEAEEVSDVLRIKLPGGTVLYDRGDRLTSAPVQPAIPAQV